MLAPNKELKRRGNKGLFMHRSSLCSCTWPTGILTVER